MNADCSFPVGRGRRTAATPLRLLALVALGLTGCRGRDSAPPPVDRDVAVVVSPVSADATDPPVVAAGLVVADETVPLAFKVPGLVASVPAEIGAAVPAGAVLARLTPTEVDATVEKAVQAVTKAERDAVRARRLFADSVIPRALADDAETALAVAREDLRLARFQVTTSEIRAPRAGRVVQRVLAAGAVVGPGVPVLVFQPDHARPLVRVGLSDREVARIRPGDPVHVTFDDGAPAVDGAVLRRAPTANPASGTFDVDVRLPTMPTAPSTGLVAHVSIATRKTATGPVVPPSALLDADGDSAEVFVVDSTTSRVARRGIRIGRLAPRGVAVERGLQVGELVVVGGGAFLTDGQRVRTSRSETSGKP